MMSFKKSVFIIEIACIILILVCIAGCLGGEETQQQTSTTLTNTQNNDITTEQDTAVTSEQPVKRVNKMCEYIDKSDVIITLDLPEEYAHLNDKTIYPSYEAGFMFRSKYGEVARSVKIASKNCGYRVGFTKEEMMELTEPVIAYAEKDSSNHFKIENEPVKIKLVNGIPTQGSQITLKITGVTQAYNHYQQVFK